MHIRTRILYLGLCLALLCGPLAGCRAGAAPAVTPTAAVTPAQPAQAPVERATAAPATATTAPPAPSPTLTPIAPTASASATLTHTATPEPFTARTLRWVDVYAGPGDAYPVVASYAGEIRFDAAARSADSRWIQIELSDFQQGWVVAANVVLSAEAGALAVLELPAEPEYTDTPQPKQKVNLWVVVSPTRWIGINANGMQPRTHHTLLFWTEKGKLKLKLGANSNEDGEFHNGYSNHLDYLTDGWQAGVYTLQLFFNDTLLAETQFTIERRK